MSNWVRAEASTLKNRPRGLQALYVFQSTDDDVVKDRSGVGDPLDLRIIDSSAVHRTEGALQVREPTLIRSERPATKIARAVRDSGEFSFELWLTPGSIDQDGPARILSISKDSQERNFTLGQQGDTFDVRLRTSMTTANGIPSVSAPTKSVSANMTHLVYTRGHDGRIVIYVDGQSANHTTISGNLKNWNENFHLALANEGSNDRPWLGTLYRVAIYNCRLTPEEVAAHHRAGVDGQPEARRPDADSPRFLTQVAPVLAEHCLECHDSSTREGGLDLSKQASARAGGDSGDVLSPGDSSKSLLWDLVDSNDMPADRPPLSDEDKELLKAWIDNGARWTMDAIDPALYVHEGNARQAWVQRLTVNEYIQTVRQTLGVDIEKEALEMLPPDLRADGFSNTAYNLDVGLQHIQAYARLAEIIVDRMDIASFGDQFEKRRRFTDDDMGKLISKVGRRLLRSPLNTNEIISFRGISTTVAGAGGSHDDALARVVEAMLQSPRFIYRIEFQRGDGRARPATPHELASRLSYIIWGGPPDKALSKAADDDKLGPSTTEAHVRRMLDDPRAVERSVHFVSQWLDLNRLENLRPNPQRFPTWDSQLAEDMQDETVEFFIEVVWRQNRPLTDLLNAQMTFATPSLARHYGLKPNGGGLSRYDVTGVPARGGLLTHGSVLTMGGDDASMVARGLFVMHDLLRGIVKAPPPCVDTTNPPTREGLTQRGIAETRMSNVNCSGCHAKFEPLAFGLEKLDGIGAYHELDEHGNRLRDDGEVLFPGAAEPVPYETSAELMDVLAASDRVRECLTWKVTQFALGRPLMAEDAPIVEKIHKASQAAGGTYASLINAIVTSDLVLLTRTAPD